MKNVTLKEKIKSKKEKVFAQFITGITTIGMATTVRAETSIKDSEIGQGIYRMVNDVTSTMMWLIPLVGILWIAFYVFKIMTGDEQDSQRYKKSITKVLVCIIAGVFASTIIKLVMGYFGK